MNFKQIATAIQNEIGDIAQITAMENGVQAKVRGLSYKINFYYKSYKYFRTDTQKSESFNRRQESAILLRLLNEANAKANRPKADIKLINDTGLDKFIEHLIAKKVTFDKQNPLKKGEINRTSHMMQILIDEAKCYQIV